MRIKHLPAFLLIGALLILAGPHSGYTQPGGPQEGGFGGGKGKGGKGKGGFDPNKMFDWYAKGKDVLVIAEMDPPRFGPDNREKMKEFLVKKGIGNGQMTRDLYAEFFQGQMAEWQAKREAGGGPPGPGGPPAGTGSEDEAREIFKKMDRDNSGGLSPDEVKGPLAGQFAKYDKNSNGVLEFDEFKEYWKDRAASRAGGMGPIVWGQTEAPVVEDKRPTVYRFGNLPKELPTWFEKLDRDKDGQVGLYEWKSEGKPVAEFLALDQNGDGFLTVEEMLRFEKAKAKKEADAKSAAAGTPPPTRIVAGDRPAGRGGFGGKDGGFGAFKGGKGGFKGGKGGRGKRGE